ncbi:MAG: AAA family ATPase [Muribaculaceae bacterium]|nr:AAA family ATPase [Muribaculaceae bacterium]
MEIKYTQDLDDILTGAIALAGMFKVRLVTPEHILLMALGNTKVKSALKQVTADVLVSSVTRKLKVRINEMERIPADDEETQVMFSYQYQMLLKALAEHCASASIDVADIPHMMNVLYDLRDSYAANCLHVLIRKSDKGEFIRCLSDICGVQEDDVPEDDSDEEVPEENDSQEQEGIETDADEDEDDEGGGSSSWRDFVLCINDHVADHNPLIGREAELERTIQVLCRKDKNNPLHIGEPGVGKTSIVYGLAQRIVDDNVPESLKNVRIYQLDLGSLIAGTQYRGDFEKRLKMVMKGVAAEKGSILYIDEIHNVVGAGQAGDGSMDASNMLKPYLEGGRVRFIGATTYEEYNRYIMRNRGFMRRFQQVSIEEPSIEEALKIVNMLKEGYEEFHQVKYDDDALELAVTGSARHITDRYLPDKAIDLIDEAGAWVQMNRKEGEEGRVDKALIASVLARVAKVDALTMDEDDNSKLETIEARIKDKIYGQDVAVQQVVEAVQMSKAGLTDENKPLASLLFVGPTGVGKTEVARVLAQELGVELVRFDMSEYVEKHTVAKLIGSPAGYVGYEDGGLLTDAVRKHPDCVLLLDEIEKAHDDIFNLLLQVMDYGTLSDNKGRKAVFRNVVLIMTSNAGAQFAHQASVGFASTVTAGQAMLKQVKKTFKPEFINRLSSIVVFNDMDRTMAGMILDKKLRELQQMLDVKKVTLKLGEEAREQLLNEGYSREYGAREMDRVIHNRLKTRLVREMLFGSLKDGGECVIEQLEQ